MSDAATYTFRANRPQLRTIRSTKKKRILIAGIGSGKSIVGGLFSLVCSRIKGARGLVLASTYDQLRDATLPRMQEVWAMLGLYEETDYVIGKRPPFEWGIDPYSSLNNANVVTFRWGAYIKLGSAEKYNAHRGPAYDWIWGDEVRDWRDPIAAVRVLVGRLRGLAYLALDMVSPILLTTSPLDDPTLLDELFTGDDVEVIRGTTFDNLHNLPADYIQTQQSTLDELTFRREVLGEDVEMGGLKACWAFSSERYPAGNVTKQDFSLDAETWMCWDFNSGASRPMSTVLYQRFMLDGRWRYVVTKEFINLRTQTPTQCEIVCDWLVSVGFKGKLHARGDKTGEHGGRGSSATQSDVLWIEKVFKSSPTTGKGWNFMGWHARTTLRKRNRMEALNAQFCTMDGYRGMLIDERCVKTLTAARKLLIAPNGNDLEENEHNDPVSAWSYGPYYDHPIHIRESKTSFR